VSHPDALFWSQAHAHNRSQDAHPIGHIDIHLLVHSDALFYSYFCALRDSLLKFISIYFVIHSLMDIGGSNVRPCGNLYIIKG